MKSYKVHLLVLILAFFAATVSACASTPTPVPTAIPTLTAAPTPTIAAPPTPVPGVITNYSYEIVQKFPHDTAAFTEGLTFINGQLYESNGQNGLSDLRLLDLDTGNVKNKIDLGAEYFGEGMTVLNGKIYQLTWTNGKGFIYDEKSMLLLGEFPVIGEGWGLTTDGQFLIMSNGSNSISYLDPENFQVKKTIYVYDKDAPLTRINELEYINGIIYANVWYTDKIVQIDPAYGEIVGWIDLTGLRSPESQQNGEAVLNGIAYDAATDRLFVTGKLWPNLFEIKLTKQ